MHPPDASLIIALATAAFALFVLWRMRQQLRAERTLAQQWQAEANRALEALHILATTARREREQLESTLRQLAAHRTDPRRDILSSIDELGDPASLADPNRLGHLATNLPLTPGMGAADLFDSNSASPAVAHLADQGHHPAYIAERLGLSLGEVEFLLSLRPA